MQNTMNRAAVFSRGLCRTCRNAPGCTFPRTAGVAVTECLEFDGEIRAEGAPPAAARPGGTRDEPVADEHGLCPWCDKRPTCVFPKPAGGVWFCEEYQ
jgi:hypothetical protein